MRWPVLVLVASCLSCSRPPPDLSAPYACGDKTCSAGEICTERESGSQCDVNPDAGIGQYQDFDFTCVPLAPACGGYPSCECQYGSSSMFCIVSDDQRTITQECI